MPQDQSSNRPNVTEEVAKPPHTAIQAKLIELWQSVLEVEVSIHDNFFDCGGDSIKAALFFNRLQQQFGGIFYIVTLFEAPTIAEFETYLHQHYPELAARMMGRAVASSAASRDRLQPEHIAQMRRLIAPPAEDLSITPKNPPACFILSAARSGSTLLRIILAGHPQLFAPPQLCLLQFNTLMERKASLSGNYSFWREGAVQALKQVQGATTEAAQVLMQSLEEQLTTQDFYGWLQQRLQGRLLVDKTTTYPLNLATLQRAETWFDAPLYIHLTRHPHGAIRSFEEAKLDLTLPPFIPGLKSREAASFNRREQAELLWLISNQNILAFLQGIPQQRQYRLRFEDLVVQPEDSIRGLCQFLDLPFDAGMLRPYAAPEAKMTEGLSSQSGMLGDLKFYQHKGINPAVADSWKRYSTAELSEPALAVAQRLGYGEAIAATSEREEGEL
ncbi:MAG: sulfotransferase [Cyanobacteria bacterium P01_F01_bin.86]